MTGWGEVTMKDLHVDNTAILLKSAQIYYKPFRGIWRTVSCLIDRAFVVFTSTRPPSVCTKNENSGGVNMRWRSIMEGDFYGNLSSHNVPTFDLLCREGGTGREFVVRRLPCGVQRAKY